MQTLRRLAPQIVTLLAVCLLVTLFFPGFLDISMSGGRLVGPVIDILKRSAPVALLAIGMTLVIATRGIAPPCGNGRSRPGAMCIPLVADAVPPARLM